jgi:poly(3-hydroxybutyrate) depolymerase
MILAKTRDSRGIRKILLSIVFIVFAVVLLGVFVGLTSKDRSILTQSYKTFDAEGVERQYLLSGPKTATEGSKILVGLHGYGDSAKRFAYYTGLHNVAGSNDIVIYPQAITPLNGQKPGWNAGFCCGSGWKQGINDAKYITDLIDSIKLQYGIESAKVYVSGFSNGAFMTQRLATDYPEKIDGIAIMSGSIGTLEKRLEPKTPVPILLMHGKKDLTIPFDGGIKQGDPDFDWLPFSETIKAWQSVNEDAAPTKEIIYPELGHQWYDWRIINFWHKQPQASKEVTVFFDSL